MPRHDKTTYTPAEMAEMLIDPYEETPKCTSPMSLPHWSRQADENDFFSSTPDAKAAMIFLCAGIAILGLFNLLTIAVRNKRISRSKRYRRAVAFYRWIESSQPKAIGWIRFPPMGVLILITVFWLFIGSTSTFLGCCVDIGRLTMPLRH